MAGCYWGLIGGLLGEKSGSRSPKWFQDLEGTPKPIPHRWHFPLGQNAYSEVLGATNGHHMHQVVGKLYVKCNFRTFLISLEPYCYKGKAIVQLWGHIVCRTTHYDSTQYEIVPVVAS